MWACTHVSVLSVCNQQYTHTLIYSVTHTLEVRGNTSRVPVVKGGAFLTSPGGHLTSFSQSGILLKWTAGLVFKGFQQPLCGPIRTDPDWSELILTTVSRIYTWFLPPGDLNYYTKNKRSWLNMKLFLNANSVFCCCCKVQFLKTGWI